MAVAFRPIGAVLALALCGYTSSSLACASCGCSLSSDWDSQGVSSSKGFKLDLRYDYLNQNQYRNATAKVTYDPATGAENETYTKNQYFTVGLDYAFNPVWGVNVQLPFIDRQHATNGVPDDPDFGTTSYQDTKKIGDAKILARYQGLSDSRNLGAQFGVKLPTGSHKQRFSSGPYAGNLVDPGLQPGTGTTDALLGAYYFTSLSHDWDLFVQGVAQLPMNTVDAYRPGKSLNLNLGLRYMAIDNIAPQLQVNTRVIAKDAIQAFNDAGEAISGATTADPNTGGRIIYLSPGVTVAVSDKVKVFGFIQVPLRQDLNGFQLAPKFTASVGARIAF